MGDVVVLPAEKGDGLADGSDAEAEELGGGKAKETRVDDSASASDAEAEELGNGQAKKTRVDDSASASDAEAKELGGGQAKKTRIDDSASASDAEAEKLGGGKAKETQVDDSASDSTPHAASALTYATKPGAHSVPSVPEKKRRDDAVRAAIALILLAASPVLRAFAAIWSKLTPLRAAFVASTLVALSRSAGDPWRSVWTFTVIAISYLALWAIYLTKAIHPLKVLISLSYVVLLAISVTHVSSAVGVFLVLLDTAYAAGLFGYALADYRQRKGLERSALALQTRVKQEQLKNNKAVITMVSFYATTFSLLSAVGSALVIFYTTDMYWVVLLLSLLIDCSLWCWTGLVAIHLLHALVLKEDHMSLIYLGTALLVLPDFLLTYLFGEAIGMLMHPIGVIGMAGVLGYNLSVYVRYKQTQ